MCTQELWYMNYKILLIPGNELNAYRFAIKFVLYNLEWQKSLQTI